MISNGQKTYQFINCDWHFLVWLKNSLCCFNCNLSCLPPEMRTYSQSMYNAIVKSSELINMKIEWNLSTNQALFWWTRLLGFSHRPIRRTQIDGLSNTIYRWWLSERERERERERELHSEFQSSLTNHSCMKMLISNSQGTSLCSVYSKISRFSLTNVVMICSSEWL